MTTSSGGQEQARIQAKLDSIKGEFDDKIRTLLAEVNHSRLGAQGHVSQAPVIERNSLRWSLTWERAQVSFELNVVIVVEDDGRAARVSRVLVHRHVSTSVDFEGHTPTTKMRRLSGLSMPEIREAVLAEMP